MKTMKGISTVVVVILLLLIAVSLIGFVFIFFQRTTETATQQGTAQLDQTTSALAKQVRIDNAAGTQVIVRHMGTAEINLTAEVSVYVNNQLAAGSWANPDTLLPIGGTRPYTLTTPCIAGDEVKVVTPASPVTVLCA